MTNDPPIIASILIGFLLGFIATFVIAKETTFIDSKHTTITQQCIDIIALGETQEYCK